MITTLGMGWLTLLLPCQSKHLENNLRFARSNTSLATTETCLRQAKSPILDQTQKLIDLGFIETNDHVTIDIKYWNTHLPSFLHHFFS